MAAAAAAESPRGGPPSGAAAATPSGNPVPMTLFAAWEMDGSAPICVPRKGLYFSGYFGGKIIEGVVA
ncbi:UNVERIFIED_CONTAM: hypothetical protein K2H54_018937 [Gekko kuhli]